MPNLGASITAPHTRTAARQLYSVGAGVNTGRVDTSVALRDYEPPRERAYARQPHEYRFRMSSLVLEVRHR